LLFGYTDASPDPEGLDPADPVLTSYEGLLPGFAEAAQLRFDSGSLAWVADLAAKGYDLPGDYRALFLPADPEGQGRLNGPALYRAGDSDTAWLAGEVLTALAPRAGEDWFAHVTFFRPHPPLVAPAPWNALHDPEEVPGACLPADPAAEKAVHPFTGAFFAEPSGFSLHAAFDGRHDLVSDPDRRALRAVYLGLAAEVDHHLGRLLDWLRATGQDDDTLIVVTGDHGEMLGDHFMWGKETVYDPAFRVPLIIRDPRNRAAAGQVVEALTESIDIAPTILEWLGRQPPPAFNGRALTPFLEGRTPDFWRDHVFMELDLGNPVEPTRYQRHLGLDLADANVAILRERRLRYRGWRAGCSTTG
jgi:arylsulfatase A-like enzyme